MIKRPYNVRPTTIWPIRLMKATLKKFLYPLIHLCLAGCALAILGLSAIYLYLSPKLPSVDSIRDVKLQTPLRIYSNDGKLIGEFGEKRRTPLKLTDVPQSFIDALLAAEDAEFYSHHGVSIKGLARAGKELIATGKKGSGGSTLTMQLSRNVFFSLEKKFERKFKEIFMSLKMERELTKDEILELYVNYMFLGKRAYGIQAASRVYYGKDINELSLAQLAMIAGLFQGPSSQNPIINPSRALQRRNWILKRMLNLNLISNANYELATTEALTAEYHGNQLDAHAPYVAELAREKTINSFGLKAYTDGYRVYTTINSQLQLNAQKAVVDGLLAYDSRHGYRGAEQQLPSPEYSTDDTESNQEEDAKLPTENWLKNLENIPSYAGLEPAAITHIEEKQLTALLKNGELITLEWEHGLSSARRYLNENSVGPKPTKVGDLFQTGDVIRVTLNDTLKWNLSQLPEVQAALVALNPDNGGIISIVGGFDFYESHFNRATQAYRQPGSNFKPFIYTAALESGLTAASLINDAPIVFNDATLEATWRPENDGGKFDGPMRIREALYRSRNLVSIRLLKQVGISKVVRSLERFGFDADTLPKDLSLALGTHALPPIDIATAWASLANGGYKIDAHLIHKVTDDDGNIIYQATPATVCRDCDKPPESAPSADEQPHSNEDITAFNTPLQLKKLMGTLETQDLPRATKIIDDRVAYIMNSMLQDVIKKGTGRRARILNRNDIAGKTGTTNGPNDAWFSGYSRDIVTTTWLGFDQNRPLGKREYGGSAALPIWIDFMRNALSQYPERHFPQPPGIASIKIDPDTGKRAKIDNPDAEFEIFRNELAPELENTPQGDTGSKPLDIFSEEIF